LRLFEPAASLHSVTAKSVTWTCKSGSQHQAHCRSSPSVILRVWNLALWWLCVGDLRDLPGFLCCPGLAHLRTAATL